MKRNLLMVVLVLFFTACNGDVKVSEQEIEEAGQKLQNKVEEGVDTLGSKLKKLKDKVDDKLDTLNN